MEAGLFSIFMHFSCWTIHPSCAFLVSPGTPHPGMPQVVLKKTEEVIAESDVVLFMVDARQGVTEADRHYAR